ncbi:prophage tail fiber N-terminal domain-containing protein, partial [Escherichia coli]|nr:prophage tail fiber N-terminal domain-containing protein [Escherichia coli]
MSVEISGILKDGAGKVVPDCAIELRARRTSPTVVVHVVATCITDSNGAYSIDAEPGYYEVSLHRNGYPPGRVGDIYVAPTDEPGTLNAFLDAPKDGDLRPEVMKRFEAMVDEVLSLSEQVSADREATSEASGAAAESAAAAQKSEDAAREHEAQSQQNAEAAAQSAQEAEQHAAGTEQLKDMVGILAAEVQKNTAAVAEDKKSAEVLASETLQNAVRAEQAVEDVDKIVGKAIDALGDAATIAGEARSSAELAAQSEQNAKQYADSAEQSAENARSYAENPVIIVPGADELPESAHGLYLVENDELKG